MCLSSCVISRVIKYPKAKCSKHNSLNFDLFLTQSYMASEDLE